MIVAYPADNIGRQIIRKSDGLRGKIIELGNYDEDDNLEYVLKMKDGSEIMIDVHGFEQSDYRFL